MCLKSTSSFRSDTEPSNERFKQTRLLRFGTGIVAVGFELWLSSVGWMAWSSVAITRVVSPCVAVILQSNSATSQDVVEGGLIAAELTGWLGNVPADVA